MLLTKKILYLMLLTVLLATYTVGEAILDASRDISQDSQQNLSLQKHHERSARALTCSIFRVIRYAKIAMI